MRKFIPFCLVITAFALAAPAAARGCVCVTSSEKPTPEQARAALVRDYNEARAVFSGKVVALDRLQVRFKLDKVWKGEFGDELLMSTGAVDNGDGTISTSSCDYDFTLGGEYLVFAYGESAREVRARLCTRTTALGRGAAETKELDEVWPHEEKNAQAPDPADP